MFFLHDLTIYFLLCSSVPMQDVLLASIELRFSTDFFSQEGSELKPTGVSVPDSPEFGVEPKLVPRSLQTDVSKC